jgi:RNA-binding protein
MTTANQTRKQYRAIGHHLKPVVIISKGLTANVLAELDRALDDHELIKIRVNAADREEKQQLIADICAKTRAELIQTAGHVALLFRVAAKQKPELSNLVRHQQQ